MLKLAPNNMIWGVLAAWPRTLAESDRCGEWSAKGDWRRRDAEEDQTAPASYRSPTGAGAGPALPRLRAHSGSLADIPDGYIAEAESSGGGGQGTACANLFDDLLVALRLRLILLSGLALRLDPGLVADEPNQTWRQS